MQTWFGLVRISKNQNLMEICIFVRADRVKYGVAPNLHWLSEILASPDIMGTQLRASLNSLIR